MTNKRASVEITLNAQGKLKSQGIVIVDKLERKRYLPIFSILKGWSKVEATTGNTNSTTWFKL